MSIPEVNLTSSITAPASGTAEILPAETDKSQSRQPWEIISSEVPLKPSRYRPITIKGEPLSETIIRDRGEY